MASILNNTARLYNLSAYVDGRLVSKSIIPGMNVDVKPEFVKALLKTKFVQALMDKGYLVLNENVPNDAKPEKKEEDRLKDKTKKKGKKKTEKVEI